MSIPIAALHCLSVRKSSSPNFIAIFNFIYRVGEFDIIIYSGATSLFSNFLTPPLPPFMIHIATAGGNIPESICENTTHSRIRKHLKNLPDSFLLEAQENENLNEVFDIKRQLLNSDNSEFDRSSYMEDFISYAKRGCFSFDRTNIHEPNDNRYHLVAYPKLTDESYDKFYRIMDKVFNHIPFRYYLNLDLGNLIKNPTVKFNFKDDKLLFLDTVYCCNYRIKE